MHDRPTILVPIRVLEGESIPDGVPELLANAHVVLLGVHVVPDQTAPGQARMQFEEKATNRLDELETILEAAGAHVETRLVFTHEYQKTIDRMIYEHECLAVLVPAATGLPENILVAIRGTVGIDRMLRVVSGLFADSDVEITLYHIIDEDETDEDAETMLQGIATQLAEAGIDEGLIELVTEHEERSLDAIVEVAHNFDVVLMGESDPSIITFVFGLPADRIAEQFMGPVLIVQRERPSEDDADSDAS